MRKWGHAWPYFASFKVAKYLSLQRKAFTLVELLVVIAIIALLTAVVLPSLSGVRNRAAQFKELNALRSTLTAWNQYATDQKGALIPAFYGNPPLDVLPAFYEDGKPIPTDVYGSQRAVVCRWPWRLAPYLGHDFRALTMQDGDDPVQLASGNDLGKYLYFSSLYPSFGMNGMWVGGDQERYGFLPAEIKGQRNPFANFYVSRLSTIRHTERLIVFASSRTNQSAGATDVCREGYFRVESPNWIGPQWSAYDADVAQSCGNVSARWQGAASVGTVNGATELVPIEELRDMRRWADQATDAKWHFSP